jgi:DNA mismatch repair protein MutS
LAVLDVICSLAKVAMNNGYTKPKFADENVIQLAKSRHPVVERLEERFIANDIFVDSGEMMIITGANMSGKSTLQRQVALIVLMAQIGSYVPCADAVLGVVDRIFTRVGAQDDLSSGQSTFMVEMNETASILHNATANSLIILDEIGRGTSTFDGVSIAWSVAEHIYNSIKAKTLFSTHYHVMNKLAEKFTRIRNYYLATKEVKSEIVFLYKLLEGGADQSFGIHVAKLAGLPYEVISRAMEIQKLLEKDDEMMRKINAKKLKEQMSLEGF